MQARRRARSILHTSPSHRLPFHRLFTNPSVRAGLPPRRRTAYVFQTATDICPWCLPSLVANACLVLHLLTTVHRIAPGLSTVFHERQYWKTSDVGGYFTFGWIGKLCDTEFLIAGKKRNRRIVLALLLSSIDDRYPRLLPLFDGPAVQSRATKLSIHTSRLWIHKPRDIRLCYLDNAFFLQIFITVTSFLHGNHSLESFRRRISTLAPPGRRCKLSGSSSDLLQ